MLRTTAHRVLCSVDFSMNQQMCKSTQCVAVFVILTWVGEGGIHLIFFLGGGNLLERLENGGRYHTKKSYKACNSAILKVLAIKFNLFALLGI